MKLFRQLRLLIFGLPHKPTDKGLKEQLERHFGVEISTTSPDGNVRVSYADGTARVCRVIDALSWTELFHELSKIRTSRKKAASI